jgi:hypothetical protein
VPWRPVYFAERRIGEFLQEALLHDSRG